MTEELAPLDVTAPVTVPQGWTPTKALKLVHDLATNLYDLDYVLNTYGLTKDQYEILSANEWFQKALDQERIIWHSADNTQKRLAHESAIAIEQALPDLAARLSDGKELLSSVTALLKVFAELAGAVGNKAQDLAPRERFKIIINLDGEKRTFEKEKPVVVIDQEPTCQSQLAKLDTPSG